MNEAIDFDFFDDPPEAKTASSSLYDNHVNVISGNRGSLRRQKSFSSSSTDSESISTHPSDLHGTQSDTEQRSENVSSSVSGQYSRTSSSSSDHKNDSDSSVSSHRTSEDELYSESKHRRISHSSSSRTLTSSDDESREHEYTLKESASPKRDRGTLQIPVPSKGRRLSSDSMTDVSPLTSPDKSPNMHSHVKSKPSEIPEDVPVRHITKLNVVFKNDIDGNSKTKQKKKLNRNHVDYHSLQWSSSESDDMDQYQYTNGQDYAKSRPTSNQGQARSIRGDSAAYRHRQRLLDSAARGSMDVSSLLETVLEFEKQNYQRKAQERRESPINYHIGEKLLLDQGGRRKNMSFTNEKVREIDQENQRLLKKIRNQSRPSSASSVRSNASTRSRASNCSRVSSASTRSAASRRREEKTPKLYHSAVNRLQFQRRIERENMQLLKRLQAAKPTPGLQRQRQLSQYKQQSDYMGTSINRSGISLQRANELTRNAEVVQNAMGLRKKSKPARPAWEDKW